MSWETVLAEPVSVMLWWFLPTIAGIEYINTHITVTQILVVLDYLVTCSEGQCFTSSSLFFFFFLSPDGQPTLLPPAHVQELNLRSTGMLNNVQRFFSHHMIKPYGCDYSTSGLSLEALQAKLRIFMEAHTADGPRHDTYVLYYSGHTHRSGEWALAGGRIITFTTGWISQVLTQEHWAVIMKRNEEFNFVFRKWNLILTI